VADASAAQTHGHFSKVAYHFQRLQNYPGSRFSWLARVHGQWASKNLDSSEKMSLGGESGVRGYAQGEGTGDHAAIFTGELRYLAQMPGTAPLGGALQLQAFVDQGWVSLHANPWAGWQGANANLANGYSLASAGVGLTWAKKNSFSVRFSLSRTLGSNPGLDINGRDSENGNSNTRAWVQGVLLF
jgi:hemolysin activation/secretion protein